MEANVNEFFVFRIRYTVFGKQYYTTFTFMKIINDELGRQAYRKVKDMIMTKQLLPGQKIVQDRLAEDLGISRTPLRSALQMLEGEYLIESSPRRGVFVKEFTDQEIVEFYDCRIALEGTAMRLFTERNIKEHARQLSNFFKPYQSKSHKIDTAAYQQSDSDFHNFIITECGNNFLGKLFNQGNLLYGINLIGLVRPPEETLNEHNQIIAAIEKGDANQAEALGKEHLNISKQLILKKIKDEK